MEVYASPEVLKCIKRQDLRSFRDVNRYKNDVFCLGLTILELGLLKSVHKVVTPDGFFDPKTLNDYMTQFEREYANNKLLLALVRAMIEMVPQKRPTFIGELTRPDHQHAKHRSRENALRLRA